jgi:ABC-type transport system involved in multi-copper enzyme maturation permease subunit
MIWRIAKKEFLLNLMTFKFAVGTTLCVVLTVFFTLVLIGDYKQRLAAYNEAVIKSENELKEARVYRKISPVVHRRPQALGVFSEAMEKALGNSVKIDLDSVPEVKTAYTEDNPLLTIYPTLDVSLVFKIVISILALLLAYDAVSGEKEQGTLRLMLSGRVARYQILIGKFLAGSLTLAIPITAAFIGVVWILWFSPVVSVRVSEWVRIGLMYVVSLVFIGVMFNLGLLVSCITKKSSTTLIFLLLLWSVFAFVVPNGSVYLASQLVSVKPRKVMDEQIKALDQESRRKRMDWYRSHRGSGRGTSPWGFTLVAERQKIERERKRRAFGASVLIEYAAKKWQVQRKYFDSLKRQESLAKKLSQSSPISLYENLMSTLAGTDLGNFEEFAAGARNYRDTVVDYIRSKTNNFSSLTYFTCATQEDIDEWTRAWEKMRESGINHREAWKHHSFDKWRNAKKSDYKPLDLRDLPRFDFGQENLASTIQRALPDLAILIVVSALFLLLSHVAFLRYDPR